MVNISYCNNFFTNFIDIIGVCDYWGCRITVFNIRFTYSVTSKQSQLKCN